MSIGPGPRTSGPAPGRRTPRQPLRADVGQRLGRRARRASASGARAPSSSMLERRRQVEDRLAVLDRDDPAGGERAAVADPVDLVDDRHARVARAAGSRRAASAPAGPGHRAARRDQRLPGHLAAEHPLQALLRAAPAEQVDLQPLQVKNAGQQLLGRQRRRPDVAGGGHAVLRAESSTARAGAVGSTGQCSGSGPVPDGSATGSSASRRPNARAATTRAVTGMGAPATPRSGPPAGPIPYRRPDCAAGAERQPVPRAADASWRGAAPHRATSVTERSVRAATARMAAAARPATDREPAG